MPRRPAPPADPGATAPRPRKKAGRPVAGGLTRERIVHAALAHLDAVGLAAFSVRDVARALDVFPTTVYWHMDSRDQLLAEVAGAVVQTATPLRDGLDWETWLRRLLHGYRQALHQHPQVAPLLGAQLLSNAGLDLDLVDRLLAALHDAGATDANIAAAYNATIACMTGFVTLELAAPPDDNERWAQAHAQRVHTADACAHPQVARHRHQLANQAFILRWQNGREVPLDAAFQAHVDIFIAGLKAFLRGS